MTVRLRMRGCGESMERDVNQALKEGRGWGDVCYSIALGVLRVLLGWNLYMAT